MYQLVLITALLVAVVSTITLSIDRADLLQIYQWSIGGFVIFCIGIFWYARLIANRSTNFTFLGVVSGSFFIKLIGALVFLYLYEEAFSPTNQTYVLHFILVYVIYTVFEVYFLTKLAKPSEDYS